jgi:hypothetical protein
MRPPLRYELRVAGRLAECWRCWFDGMQVSIQGHGETLISGCLADQAALHGVLAKIRDLNLTLVSVTLLADSNTES